MFAILPSGVWLEVRDVHSGGGWVETVTRSTTLACRRRFRRTYDQRSLVASSRSRRRAPRRARRFRRAISPRRLGPSTPPSCSHGLRREGRDSLDPNARGTDGERLARATSHESIPSRRASPAPRPEYHRHRVGATPFGCYERTCIPSYNGYVIRILPTSSYTSTMVRRPTWPAYLARPRRRTRGGSRGQSRATSGGHLGGASAGASRQCPGGQQPSRPRTGRVHDAGEPLPARVRRRRAGCRSKSSLDRNCHPERSEGSRALARRCHLGPDPSLRSG